MALSDDNLMISDKVWILVGMLLRNGQSCTPSQLSDLCHMLSFAPSEVEWLCKLPFSPLCLSPSGQVTFSQFVFQFFEAAKDRYAPPSTYLASWKRSYTNPVTASSLEFPLRFSQKTYQPLLLYEVSPNQQCANSPAHIGGAYLEQTADRDRVRKPCSPSVKRYFRKRHRSAPLDGPAKRQHRSTTTTETQAIGSDKTDILVSGRLPIKSKQSTTEDSEKPATSTISLDAKYFSDVPVKVRTVEQDITFTDCLSSYTQQSCTASVSCIGKPAAEFDNNISIHLQLDREVPMVDVALDNEKESINAISISGYVGNTRKPEIVDDVSDIQYAVGAKGQLSQTMYNNEGCDFNSKGNVHIDNSPQFAQRNLQFVQNSSNKHLKNDIRVVYVSPADSEAVTCHEGQQQIVHNEKIRGDFKEDVGVACKTSKQFKGKALKDPQHKNLNTKQTTKLRKLKKASGSRREPAAGCSEVAGACSHQVAEEKHPSFDGFIVEAVEGSGGYGTVYKAMKKDGGKLVAIKYPFERTSPRHVQNEIKFLQKYGGQNFIPKCLEVIEESGKQCLVLDYIEHEKPEVLKREISISDLQLYGFSLFKALEYLHSKGVIHRDVKPGNFLFSRNKKCGWLIDFNLATVQTKLSQSGQQKQTAGRAIDRSPKVYGSHQRSGFDLFTTHEGSPHQASLILNNQGKNAKTKFLEGVHHESFSTTTSTPARDFKVRCQEIRSPAVAEIVKNNELLRVPANKLSPSSIKVLTSKEHDVSRIKSRPSSSAHRSPLKEQGMVLHQVDLQKGEQVLPRYGRRELWEIVQKSQNGTQTPVSSLPSSQKKRVAAPQKRKHQRPFPGQSLFPSNALAVSKTSLVKAPVGGHVPKARVSQKLRKEGPCAGTKGYRAPEVLLKSLCQTEKIDIWSAGVSLFQLVLGRSPFSSSSNLNQSLLDIAQFCGADAICALAKELNRESSLSKELIAMKVQPTALSLWFEKNTKRPNLLSLAPLDLFDLLEKCLQINPKNRISAKEALQHEFFDSCRNSVPIFTSFTRIESH